MAKKQQAPPRELTDAEVVALVKSVGDARFTKAREAIANGTTLPVNFSVSVVGNVVRAAAIPDSTKLITDNLILDLAAIHSAALKACGVKVSDFDEAFFAAEKKALVKLGKEQAAVVPRSVPVKGRDGNLTVAVDVVPL